MPTDVVVIGLGVMGSATALALARRGERVVGIEQFSIGHDRGSSHGHTRVIRLGYFEHPSYVPLLRSAYRLWRELETESGQQLLQITGIVEIGAPDSEIVAGTIAASKQHDLPHTIMEARAAMARFPAFRLPAHYLAVVQPDGGYLFAERSVQVFAGLARTAGAEMCSGETVLAIEPRSGRVTVITDRREIEAGAVVVTAGPWLKKLLPDLPAGFQVMRQVQGWFEPLERTLFEPGKFPVFIMASPYGNHYGFPLHEVPPYGGLLKIAKHDFAAANVDPDGYDRTISARDEANIRVALEDYLPAANGRLVTAATCLYTVTQDRDFLIDRYPDQAGIIVASPCSGHGFKFAPVIGEILADLVTRGTTAHDISRFALGRPGGTD